MRLFLLVWREVGGVEKGLIRGGAKTRSVRESRLAVALEEFSQCNLVVYKRRRGIHVQRSDGSCQPLQLLQSSLIAFAAATVGRASSTSPKRTDPTEIEPSDGGKTQLLFVVVLPASSALRRVIVVVVSCTVSRRRVAQSQRTESLLAKAKKGWWGFKKETRRASAQSTCRKVRRHYHSSSL